MSSCLLAFTELKNVGCSFNNVGFIELLCILVCFVACVLLTWLAVDLNHMSRTISSNLSSLLDSKQNESDIKQKIALCGLTLLDWFCEINWIGPFQNDLHCPFLNDPKTLVSKQYNNFAVSAVT